MQQEKLFHQMIPSGINIGAWRFGDAVNMMGGSDKTLRDSLGNFCRVELHKTGWNEFELYLHNFNSEIPKRYVGGLGELNARADRWLEARKADGFVELK